MKSLNPLEMGAPRAKYTYAMSPRNDLGLQPYFWYGPGGKTGTCCRPPGRNDVAWFWLKRSSGHPGLIEPPGEAPIADGG